MTEQLAHSSAAAAPGRRKLFPGYLLTPFGWAAQPLIEMIAADPTLLPHVFELNRPRMHVIGLALAHLGSDAVPKIGPVLLQSPARQVLHRVLGGSPIGLKRVLRRLPFAVLS